jgi:hypothetical protein
MPKIRVESPWDLLPEVVSAVAHAFQGRAAAFLRLRSDQLIGASCFKGSSRVTACLGISAVAPGFSQRLLPVRRVSVQA